MILIREFAIVYVLWIVYVCGIKKETSPQSTTTSKLPRKCMSFSKNPCDLCLESGLHAKDHALFFSDTYAPANCTNGNVNWVYPFGNGKVHFPITGREAVSICLQNEWSSKLIFHGITSKERVPLNNLCTKKYHFAGEVVVLVSGLGVFSPVLPSTEGVYLQKASYILIKYQDKGKYHPKGAREN